MIGTAAAASLPALRQELRIEPGAPLVDGAPSWTLFDPVRHMFFQLGRLEFRILALWSRGDVRTMRAGLAEDGLDAENASDAIRHVVDFAVTHNLTLAPPGDAVAALEARRRAAAKDWWRFLLDHYLFIRMPLVRPTAFLRRTLPRVAPLWSRASLTLFACAALLGVMLAARRWDVFLGSFRDLMSAEGALAFGVALLLVKAVHELGHAYTATRYGVPVPSMGVSLLVMMPVLYTDTTGAWRLRARAPRIAIACAGVGAELMAAAVTTLLWNFLPDGPARTAAFVLATTSWATSLFINLNPFMRMDGYYVLSDLLGVPNLQARSFALARWRMRELLFALGEPLPEEMPRRLRRGLIAYAVCAWIYRLVLYVGIALLVYHFFFKALGLILFAAEMWVFIMKPIAAEAREWRSRMPAISRSPRARKLAWAAGGALLLAFLPLDQHVTAPAVLAPIGDAPVVAGDPARLDRIMVRDGEEVAQGQPLFELSAPELDRDIAVRRVAVARLQLQIARAGGDAEDLSNRAVLDRELIAERDALAGLLARKAAMLVRSPTAGRVADLDPQLTPGRWLNGAETLARVISPGRNDVQAYLDERDIWRVEPGAEARFVPDDAGRPSWRARLVERASSAAVSVDLLMLASVNGGPIAVDAAEAGRTLKPRSSLYRARLIAEQGSATGPATQPVSGEVVISARPESFAARVLTMLGAAFARERSLTQ